MAKVFLQGHGLGAGITGTQWSMYGNSPRLSAVGPTAAHDIGVQYTNRVPGVCANLYTKVITNTWNVAGNEGYRCRLRYNDGASYGTMVTQYLNQQTGEKSDLNHTDNVADGDILQYEWTKDYASGSGTITPTFISVAFTPTSGTSWMYAIGEKVSISIASQTRFWSPVGNNNNSTTEADNQMRLQIGQTISNMAVNAFTNLRTTNTVFTLRKNNAAETGLQITFGNLETGLKEDITGSVSYAVGDYLAYSSLTSTGSEVMEVTTITVKSVSADDHFQIGGHGTQVVLQSATEYVAVTGNWATSTTTETDVRANVPFGMILSKFSAYARVNSTTADSTLLVRKNGATVATLTWPATTPGLQQDLVTEVSFAADDELSIALVAGAGGTSIEFNSFTCLCLENPAARVGGLLLGV